MQAREGERSAETSEEVPDVTATINVNDDIVRGTTSVQQSFESHPVGSNVTEPHQHNQLNGVQGSSVIKVRHYIDSENGTSLTGTAHLHGFAQEHQIERLTQENGTPAAFRSPLCVESDSMTDQTLQLQKMNTVPMPQTAEGDDWDEQLRRAVVTRDSVASSHSGELPKELYASSPQEITLGEGRSSQHDNGTFDKRQLMLATEGSEACKEVIEQDEEDDEYSDDVDQMSKSPAARKATQAAAGAQTKRASIDGVTRFESNTSQRFKSKGQAAAAKLQTVRPQQQSAQSPDPVLMEKLEKLVISLNHQAMAHLKIDQFALARRLLLKAEINLLQVDQQCDELRAATDSIGDLAAEQSTQQRQAEIDELDSLKNRLMGLTYNNFGCLCKQQKDFKGALEYLKKALDFESRLEDYRAEDGLMSGSFDEKEALDYAYQSDLKTTACNSAGTILNICAILSKINKHAQAHEYAEEAVVKLKHSMKLTKGQAQLAAQKVERALTYLEEAQKTKNEGSAELINLEEQLARQGQLKIDLENQWINLATTAVIAHYNSAVELEFMSLWRESLNAYEKASRLASIAMKAQNPMSQKIAQAISKMRMKVRNKVQLPEKLSLQAVNLANRNRRQQGRSQITGNSKITSQMQGSLNAQLNIRDWQTSVNSTVSGAQEMRSTKVVMNNDFAQQNSDLQPAITSFYPEDSLHSNANPASSIDMPQAQMTQYSKQPKSRDANDSVQLRKTPASNPQQQRRVNQKSPLSLKTIINKLEKTERNEAKQLFPKSKLRNTRQFQTMTSCGGSIDDDCMSGTQTAAFQSVRIGLGSRNQRTAINSAGAQSIDPNFLPSLNQPRGKTGFFSTRNGGIRQQTVQGIRSSLSPSRDQDRQTASTVRPKWDPVMGGRNATRGIKPRGGSLLPPPVVINDWVETEQPERRSTQQQRVSIEDPTKKRLTQLGYGNLTPTRLQIQLSRAQERRLAEQSKKIYLVTNKRDQEINQMLGPLIKKPAMRNPKKPAAIGPLTADFAAGQAQSILGATPTAANMACSAYLPKKLKNSIKQKQMAKEASRNAHYRKASITQQLETTFQKEMAAWKRQRGSDANATLNKFYQGPTLRSRLDEPSHEKINVDAHQTKDLEYTQEPPIVETKNFETTLRSNNNDQYDVLSAEQAQEAISMNNESQAKLSEKQENDMLDSGPSIDHVEEEVGNFRASPGTEDGKKSRLIEDKKSLQEHPQMVLPEQKAPSGQHGTPKQESREDSSAKTGGSHRPQQEMTFNKHRGSSKMETTGVNVSPVQHYTSQKAESQTYSLAQIVNGQQRDQNATCQEVLIERVSPKYSETIEVEDIVSADTNNLQGGMTHRFQSYRTSSNMINNQTDVVLHNETPGTNMMSRMNNDSGLKTASLKGGVGTAGDNTPNATTVHKKLESSNRRSQNVKSSLAMTPSHKLEALAAQDNVAESVEVREQDTIVRHRTRHGVPINANEQEYAEYREMHRVSQNGGSSIVDSQVTETVQTHQSENKNPFLKDGETGKAENQIDTLHDSTIHEDTIDAWKLQVSNNGGQNGAGTEVDFGAHNYAETPDMTDENDTVGGEQNSQIGDGPIYIKKSTDYHATTGRRMKYMGSQSSLEQTEFAANTLNTRKIGTMLVRDSTVGLQRAESRQVSDITQQTEFIRYQNDIKQGKTILVASFNVKDKEFEQLSAAERQDLLLTAQRNSEAMTGECPSNMSIEPMCHADDSQSHETLMVRGEAGGIRSKTQYASNRNAAEMSHNSGKIRVQDEQPGQIGEDISSFLTPRPGITSGLIKREIVIDASSRVRLERSSVETEVQPAMPKHIQHSKSSRRPPAGAQRQSSLPKQSLNNQQLAADAMPFKIKPGQELLRQKQQRNQKNQRAGTLDKSQHNSEIPSMIHQVDQSAVENQRKMAAIRTTVASPAGFAGGMIKADALMTASHEIEQRNNLMGDSKGEVAAVTGNLGSQEIQGWPNVPDGPDGSDGIQMLGSYHRNSAVLQEDSRVSPGGQMMEKPIHTEDRVAKIAEQISKLNTNLLQFQSEIEESRKDPLLKSTHRSTASKKGLTSQKSRDTNVGMTNLSRGDQQSQTDVMVVPAQVRALQDQRLASQLQSAPGRSRAKM